MKSKRATEILTGVLLIMSTIASIVALILCQPSLKNVQSTIDAPQLLAVNVLLGSGALITASLLRSAKLVPPFISTLGSAAGLIICLRGILITLGLLEQLSLWGVLLAIPFFGYEISLTIQLLAKGFNEAEPTSLKQNLFRLSKNEQ